ncbi:hypothetical protein [Castellaniella sp.]|uniref:hypothetical protein n=1 Tax=Castellaniella sp. TaxID=1955812 RepID=UPI002AFEC6D9|nr:hypothetical protein [Castellaniella sp.]
MSGDFGLISVAERQDWREALACHLLSHMRQANGEPLARWKVEEQIQPMLVTIHTLISDDPLANQKTLEGYFIPASLALRSDYAS